MAQQLCRSTGMGLVKTAAPVRSGVCRGELLVAHASTSSASVPDRLTITRPDDWHLHVRDGAAMRSVVPHTARQFSRAIIMPNLAPPVTSAASALAYRKRIMDTLPQGTDFTPLMTCYLTDKTSPADVAAAKDAGVVAYKLYPAGATTNSDSGVTDILKVVPTLEAMAALGVPLLVHGEVTDSDVDMFDREAVFIQKKLIPILEKVPKLRVVMEHITTKDAAEFVASAPANVAATVTPQHMLLNRNALFVKGLRPHNYCLPVLKREKHREAVADAATSGSKKFFLGTDSAPHPKGAKESACGCAGMFTAPLAMPLYATAFEQAGRLQNLEAFASFNGPDFYGLPRNTGKITLLRQPMTIPEHYDLGDTVVVPMWAGQELKWRLSLLS
uniref:Dihydroorotase, mitochondrial n=1 Tax=Chlamydomonas leiostraca TaxID=1034604 RepID=A0A7S0S3P0_9CHLO|mmetsp:Transcript_7376/g.18318  ORF Transcript_7376/g.18318 Transcript_7376/m.18318 type:complete len:387 (+) Transcript_7376:52-1212(+)|eukprot:CAMPEP_0202860288 /NCGR_PEP_ID=MMETSP1391-20130828/2056_1 /ASSEMBLY_ACC=CAM_ASM_000867 /TAXON_ID=1034604 /ORGANISM="Chlamydomonas leiostraca, Strain SAG 11-49" /LENGTH=386 /DNA_ID=CAMNT_0049539435 /DNA_START=52 /DNA_END=1212 /DNA_ORIENTATION=-